MNLKQIGMIALIMALVCVMPAFAAANEVPVTIADQKFGLVEISIRDVRHYTPEGWERYVSIAPYDNNPVIHPDIGANGIRTISLPVGKYYIVLPKGYGSGFNTDTWIPEAVDIEVTGTGLSYVHFTGAGL